MQAKHALQGSQHKVRIPVLGSLLHVSVCHMKNEATVGIFLLAAEYRETMRGKWPHLFGLTSAPNNYQFGKDPAERVRIFRILHHVFV